MATKAKSVTLAASSVDILNAIRNSASQTYQDRVPVATQNNIKEVGNPIITFEAIQNEFLHALVNRIGRVLITSKSYENPLKRFKKGILEYGETVEEIFINIARAHEFDPNVAENEVFKREIPDVNAAFHRLNVKNFYKTTISNEQLRQAFLSTEGVSDLIARIVDSLYTGSEFDEFLIMKEMLADGINNGEFYAITVPEPTADNAHKIVTTIKGISNKLEFMSNIYNPMGVVTHSKKRNQILIVDAAFDAVIDVNVLASAFNMDKAEFMGQRILIDDFSDTTGVVAAIVDESWFMVFDNFIGFTENYNGQGLYWNYFYHVWKTYSKSPFANAVLFTTATNSITSVSVTPSTLSVSKGQYGKFTANVVVTGTPSKLVTWSVNSDNSTIDNTGMLYVSPNETLSSLTVTATSVVDGTKTGTATVTVTE